MPAYGRSGGYQVCIQTTWRKGWLEVRDTHDDVRLVTTVCDMSILGRDHHQPDVKTLTKFFISNIVMVKVLASRFQFAFWVKHLPKQFLQFL